MIPEAETVRECLRRQMEEGEKNGNKNGNAVSWMSAI